MGKFDGSIEWLRKQMENAAQALLDLKAGRKLEISGRDVTKQWKAKYEQMVARYKKLIDAYQKRND
jgi:hypothetical protein